MCALYNHASFTPTDYVHGIAQVKTKLRVVEATHPPSHQRSI